ncbi:MAG: type II toxin-antitoxin system VapC family toxin [Caldilineaceae bacterium]|nr:type II toxin-antitoxin system VapC family toxin [Caldilineaceae bacterium]
MTRYLLDTNHLSPLVSVGHPLRQRILAQRRRGDDFALPVPALTELLYGIHLTLRAVQNLAEWQRLQHSLGLYPINQLEAELAAELQTSLRRRGWQLATVDALIAAVALRHDLTLLTTDGDFAAVPGLVCENWLR